MINDICVTQPVFLQLTLYLFHSDDAAIMYERGNFRRENKVIRLVFPIKYFCFVAANKE